MLKHEDSFVRKVLVPGTTPRLICDSLGAVPVPTIFAASTEQNKNSFVRSRRKIIEEIEADLMQPTNSRSGNGSKDEVEQTPDAGQDEESDEDFEDLLYDENDFLDVEDEEMSEYAHSQLTEGTDLDSDTEELDEMLSTRDRNAEEDPKFVVFFTQLLLLFKFCFVCKSDGPSVTATKCGTMVSITTQCINPACRKEYVWKSQPLMTGTFLPNHLLHWQKYKKQLLDKLSVSGQPVVLAGDAQHDNSTEYRRLKKELTKKPLLKAIKKVSNDAQTSCLEGFHSVINQFAPKMICYSHSGMFCRTALAAMHFNYNIKRNVAKKRDGSRKVKIVFPKFKNGEATVRDKRIPPNFDYIQDIFQTMEEALQNPENLQSAASQLKRQTPQHMDTMLPKQPREVALQQWLHKQSLVVVDVPSTNPVESIVQPTRDVQPMRAKPVCSICKKPMKGHKNVSDCPKNK
eukprot:gene16326-biopygen12007